MRDDPLPDEDHVVRYVGGSKVDGTTVDPSGFAGTQPSVNWLECTNGTKNGQIDRVRGLLRLHRRATAKLVELKVGVIRRLRDDLDVLEKPLPADEDWPAAPCHAEIVSVPADDQAGQLVREALADSVIGIHDAVLSANGPR